jgi:hypothetical protein
MLAPVRGLPRVHRNVESGSLIGQIGQDGTSWVCACVKRRHLKSHSGTIKSALIFQQHAD